jgi:hypothetical protein
MGDVIKFKKPPVTFQDVIDLWPSMSCLAEDLEVEYDTVRKWRDRGRVPQEYFQSIIDAARKRRIRLKAADLVEVASA